jgi:malonyl CoA-acyl carrier protein transacylase/NAD(P)-dependent dehydrogenase (short-subunit alcohol dehydrogenase family)/acyl carrier protein
VALEEYSNGRRHTHRLRSSPTELVLLSAPGPDDLIRNCESLQKKEVAEDGLAHVARASQQAFDSRQMVRLALVATDPKDLREKAAQAAAKIRNEAVPAFRLPNGVYFSSGTQHPDLAVLFPGQGSQFVGAGADLCMAFDSVRTLWDRDASLAFDSEATGSDGVLPLSEIVFPPPVFTPEERDLQRQRVMSTDWAQPVLGALSASVWNLFRSMGLRPLCFAGHSFGELTALYAAGAFEERPFLAAARMRGQLMKSASGQGAMTSVFARLEDVREVLAHADSTVVIANHNTPKQVIVSGLLSDIEAAEIRFKEAGLAARRLGVSGAFHTPQMEPCGRSFRDYLNSVPMNAPGIAVFSNTTAGPYPLTADESRSLLVDGMVKPVRFVDEIEAMYAYGARTFLEVGPNSILSGLIGEILAGRPHAAIPVDRKGVHGLTSLWHALGQLAVTGQALDFAPIWNEYDLGPDPSERKKPPISIRIDGVNYQKPYPPADGEQPKVPVPRPVERTEPVDGTGAWVGAYQEIQRQTAEIHITYQRTMADAHMAFLKAAEASANQLARLRGNGETLQRPDEPTSGNIQFDSSTVAAKRENIEENPVPSPKAVYGDEKSISVETQARPAIYDGSIDIQDILFSVVAKSTGYPKEVLLPEMELETTLGIDSIKRVEILSDLEAQFPGQAFDLTDLASLRTLGEIVDFMKRLAGVKSEQVEQADPEHETAGDETLSSYPSTPYNRYVLRVTKRDAVGTGLRRLKELNSLAIIDDGDGVGAAVRDALNARSIASQVFPDVDSVPDGIQGIIMLRGLRSLDVSSALRLNRETFEAARKLDHNIDTARVVLVSVQDTGGDFGIRRPSLVDACAGGLSALAKTVALEWKHASVKAIDIERGDRSAAAIAALICQELFTGSEVEVGLPATGDRFVIDTETAPLVSVPESLPIHPGAALVVSGGGRGVTAEALKELIPHVKPRLLILGRSRLVDEPSEFRDAADESAIKRILLEKAMKEDGATGPTPGITLHAREILAQRELRNNLKTFGELGATVRYAAVDVREEALVAEAVQQVRAEWGTFAGFIHGAGVLADKRIVDKSGDQFDLVFDTKVRGFQSLLSAMRLDPLQLIFAFSSVVAHSGNSGQADYAMANAVLNRLAAHEAQQRGHSCRVKSISWGPWRGGMVTAGLQRLFESRGFALIEPEHGAQMFWREVCAEDSCDVILAAETATPKRMAAAAGVDEFQEELWPR